MKLPVISRFKPDVTLKEAQQAARLAGVIRKEQPQLDWKTDNFRNLVVEEPIDNKPTLHLDDFSEIPVIGKSDNSRILQQRARLRAVDGDWVAQSRTVERGFSDYCESQLGLGRVHWLTPAFNKSNTRQIALECWQDRRVRHDLIQAIRHDGLRYIHPHNSTMHVWELAALLSSATRMPISVIGPTPAMSRWCNNKIEFTRTAARLLGSKVVPHTESAFNFSMLAKNVLRLAATNDRLCVKFPYGTGGDGNFLVESSKINGRSLSQVHQYLRDLLSDHRWPESGRVLIDVWETNVISSPSIQTWIPPFGNGEPVIEGLFDQVLTGEQKQFVGSSPANLPPVLAQAIVNQSYLLANLFQQLGYVGRCSFDLILVGDDTDDCHIEFIECNARWGGSSITMTLMNRLETIEHGKTFGTRKVQVDGLCRIEFPALLRRLGEELFNPVTGQGRFVLFNPARIEEKSAVEAIAIGDTPTEVNQLLATVLPAMLEGIVQKSAATHSSPADFLLGHAGFETTSSQE